MESSPCGATVRILASAGPGPHQSDPKRNLFPDQIWAPNPWWPPLFDRAIAIANRKEEPGERWLRQHEHQRRQDAQRNEEVLYFPRTPRSGCPPAPAPAWHARPRFESCWRNHTHFLWDCCTTQQWLCSLYNPYLKSNKAQQTPREMHPVWSDYKVSDKKRPYWAILVELGANWGRT